MNAYSNHYRNNQIMTASPEQILIMLFDGAIRFVHQAGQAIEEGRIADKAVAINKAIAIVTEFSNTLNFEVGGEIAEDLYRLYDFVIRELVAVNARSDAKRLVAVERILLDLREGFVGAIEANRSNVQAPVAAAAGEARRVAASF